MDTVTDAIRNYIQDTPDKRDYQVLSELVEKNPKPAFNCLLEMAREGKIDINKEDGRKIWAISLGRSDLNPQLKSQVIGELSEIYKSPKWRCFESAAVFFWGGIGAILHSAYLNRSFDYADKAKSFLQQKHQEALTRYILNID